MLAGLKSKPKSEKAQNLSVEESPNKTKPIQITKNQDISELIKSEKNVNSNDYHSDLIKNLKLSKKYDEEEEEKYHINILNSKKNPITLKTSNCEHCIESKGFQTELFLNIEDSMHISLSTQGSLVPGHCIISPNDHVLAITELESDELEDLQELKRKVLKLYKEEYGKKGIFVEAVYRLEDCNHTFVECFPIDADALEDLYATVMQELSEADDE